MVATCTGSRQRAGSRAPLSVFSPLSALNASHNGAQLSDTASVASDRSEEILVFTHNSEERSAFNSDYLPLSLQSANCTLIVLHKKPVKFITASSQWLFWYWLKGLIKAAEREAAGQISDSEVIHEVVTCDGLETRCGSSDTRRDKAYFCSESFPILMWWTERSFRPEQEVTLLPLHLSALSVIHRAILQPWFSRQASRRNLATWMGKRCRKNQPTQINK